MTGSSRERGVSLVESVVVLMIGIVILFSLWPVATGLLRQQRKLSAEALSVESFPFLYERLAADFTRAAAVAVEPEIESPSFRLILFPGEPDAPAVRWDFQHESVRRTAETQPPSARTWRLDGTFSLRRDDLLHGRCVVSFARDGDAPELLAFRPGGTAGRTP